MHIYTCVHICMYNTYLHTHIHMQYAQDSVDEVYLEHSIEDLSTKNMLTYTHTCICAVLIHTYILQYAQDSVEEVYLEHSVEDLSKQLNASKVALRYAERGDFSYLAKLVPDGGIGNLEGMYMQV
jgi:hypothetical protein